LHSKFSRKQHSVAASQSFRGQDIQTIVIPFGPACNASSIVTAQHHAGGSPSIFRTERSIDIAFDPSRLRPLPMLPSTLHPF
jgi:hypothetical protein